MSFRCYRVRLVVCVVTPGQLVCLASGHSRPLGVGYTLTMPRCSLQFLMGRNQIRSCDC